MRVNKKLTRPLIFGLADGAMSIMGVIMFAAGHAAAVFPLALSGGVSASLSMGGSEWLSDSENGFLASLAMAGSTLVGSILPAVPYAILPGFAAPVVSLVLLAGVAALVGYMRRGAHRRHPYLESAGILVTVLLASVGCALWL